MNGFHKMSRAEYDRAAGVRCSEIHWACKSLAYYYYRKQKPQREDYDVNQSLILGMLIHRAILEPDVYDSTTVVTPPDAPPRPQERWRNAKKASDETRAAFAYWDAFTANTRGKLIIDHKLKDHVENITQSVLTNPRVSEILARSSRREIGCFSRHDQTGMLCKSSMDIVEGDNSCVWDIKTTSDSEPEQYRRSVLEYGYHRQGAYYVDHFPRLDISRPSFGHIIVETVEPYLVSVRKFDDESLAVGRAEYNGALHNISRSITTETWPGYEQQETGLPEWYLRKTL